jgi:uncharacterized protein (DUF433 family)
MTTVVNTPRAIGHYSTYEVARLAGVSPRRIGRWHELGVIPATGRVPGTYSYADAAEAVLAHYLVNQGLRPGDVSTLVENLRDDYGLWPLATAPLEHEGRLVVVREGERLYLDAMRRGQRVIEATLDLRQVRNALAHGGWVSLEATRELIEVDPFRLSGVPTVRGRRVPTELIAALVREEDGKGLLRSEYDLSRQEIAEAVRYEDDVRRAMAA